jgi:hypothetical protein
MKMTKILRFSIFGIGQWAEFVLFLAQPSVQTRTACSKSDTAEKASLGDRSRY